MKTPLLTIMAFVCISTNTAAWNDIGYLMVAASAYDQLTQEVQQKVSTLLKQNPKYAT